MVSPRLLIGRVSEPGNWYVITAITRNRERLFLRTACSEALVDEINAVNPDHAQTHAFVVMPDHFHWMFTLGDVDLSRVVQGVKSRSAIRINRARRESSTVWQPGFYDHRLRGEEDFQAQARYLVENPLRSGLVERIEDYPFWWCRWIERQADLGWK